jgi:hypothetical protein
VRHRSFAVLLQTIDFGRELGNRLSQICQFFLVVAAFFLFATVAAAPATSVCILLIVLWKYIRMLMLTK